MRNSPQGSSYGASQNRKFFTKPCENHEQSYGLPRIRKSLQNLVKIMKNTPQGSSYGASQNQKIIAKPFENYEK